MKKHAKKKVTIEKKIVGKQIKTIKKTHTRLLVFEEVSYKDKPLDRAVKFVYKYPRKLYYFPIAGMRYALKNIKVTAKLFNKMTEGDFVTIKHERNNEFDIHACAIYFKDQKLGYIPKEYNKEIIKLAQKKKSFTFMVHKTVDFADYYESYKCPVIVAICY